MNEYFISNNILWNKIYFILEISLLNIHIIL